MDPQPRNLAQLATALESAWLNIPENTFRDLSDSLPARLAAVRSAKEGYIGRYTQPLQNTDGSSQSTRYTSKGHPNHYPAVTAHHHQQHRQKVHRTSALDFRRIEESHLVRQITFTGQSQWWTKVDYVNSERKPGP
ncbi:transposable element Tcb1 transposase [Trichonephila clavipes]|uniref:Transposable element Tcb1 transposase n=1 Tax=Trichonephila clavipes TaxID=2585209 RepID=A0A8X6RTX7_TRICX|nr:transposable element Tcb1 transposase [Trichonephila clavipes]